MTAKLPLLAVVAVTSAITAGTRYAQEQRRPTSENLGSRATTYYALLQQRKFADAWTFFTRQLQIDTPRDQYANELAASSVAIRLNRFGPVTLNAQGAGKGLPEGTVLAALTISGADKRSVEVTQRTIWRWQTVNETADWYLVKQENAEPARPSASEAFRQPVQPVGGATLNAPISFRERWSRTVGLH